MRFAVLALLVSLVVAPPAAGQSGVTRASIESMLSGYEEVPPLAEWRALGPAAVPLLIAIHDDRQVIQPLRLRAVEAMGAFSTPEARAFLTRVMSDPDEGVIVVREAAEALAQSAGEGAVQPIARLLRRSDRDLREGAIVALSRIQGPSARQALTAHLARETDAGLSAQITALLAR